MDSALDTILRHYVRRELNASQEDGHGDGEGSSNASYVREIHECLERKGVTRELQAFLRQKLVLILQDKWPQLTTPPDRVDSRALQLVQDFLASRKLLFTFSVFVGEAGINEGEEGAKFEKLRNSRAESLLVELGIGKGTPQNKKILRKYADSDELSILECVLDEGLFPNTLDGIDGILQNLDSASGPKSGIDCREKVIDDLFDSNFQDKRKRKNSNGKSTATAAVVEERIKALKIALEEEKDAQVQRWKDQEEIKIREELKHKFEFEVLAKEKDLLSAFKERAEALRQSLEQEKATWNAEKERQERVLAEKQRQLDRAIDSLPIRSSVTHPERRDDTNFVREPLVSTIKRQNSEESSDNHNCASCSRASPRTKRDTLQEIENDKLAFLQYNLERQSEEIQKLRDELLGAPTIPKSNPPPTKLDTAEGSNPTPRALLDFLRESRQRCEKIEEQARNVDLKLREIRTRRSRSTSPVAQHILSIAKIKASISRPKSSGIFPFPHSLLPSTDFYSPPFSTQQSAIRRKEEETTKISEPLKSRRDPVDQPSAREIEKEGGNSLREAIHKLKSEATLARALRKGALSIEKVQSSEDEGSQSKSLPRPTSSKQRSSGNSNQGKRGDGEIPVKLDRDNDSSLSLSVSVASHPKSNLNVNGSKKDNGNGENSGRRKSIVEEDEDGADSEDFWKL